MDILSEMCSGPSYRRIHRVAKKRGSNPDKLGSSGLDSLETSGLDSLETSGERASVKIHPRKSQASARCGPSTCASSCVVCSVPILKQQTQKPVLLEPPPLRRVPLSGLHRCHRPRDGSHRATLTACHRP